MDRLRTGNRRLMREMNTRLLLNVIRDDGLVSHSDIRQKTQLSAGAVTSIVRELKDRNLIKEVGPGISSKGRKPTLLQFNSEARYVISAGIFADETRIAVMDLGSNVKKQIKFRTEVEKGPDAVFANFAQQTLQLIKDVRIPKEKFLGVGIGFEGVIDSKSGSLVLSSQFGWRNVPIKEKIEAGLGISTFVDSEGAVTALGEYRNGAGRGHDDVVVMLVDAGIGGVDIFQGRIRKGSHHMAGEVGHTRMVPDGETCRCGRTGCLETVAAGWAIVQRVREAIKRGENSRISDEIHSPSTRRAVGAVFQAGREGDELATAVIRQAGEYLGKAVAAIINYADPEIIILSGCVADEGQEMLLGIIRKSVAENVLDSEIRTIHIEQGTLGRSAVLIGAASLVCEEAFKLPISF